MRPPAYGDGMTGSAGPGGEADTAVRALLDLSPHPVVGVDGSGRVVLVNALAERLTGWSHEELVGRPVEDLIPEEQRAQHARLRTAYHRSPVRREVGELAGLRCRRRDGSLLPVDVALTPLPVAGGDTWVLAALSDISERLAAENRVLDLTRAYRMLAAMNQAVLRADTPGEVLGRRVARPSRRAVSSAPGWAGAHGGPASSASSP